MTPGIYNKNLGWIGFFISPLVLSYILYKYNYIEG